ncbi:MAG: class I SAM-dependent methyltransferase [Pseudomonadota bacterium]
MNQSKQERLIRMGMRTVTGQAREGFFIPYRYADGVPERVEPYAALEPAFTAARPGFEAVITEIDTLADEFRAVDGTGSDRARWDQYWCPRLDAMAAYTMVRTKAPKRVIEVGSGHSTRFMARAVADGGLDCAMTAIDPEPRAQIAELPITIERKTLQEVDPALFGTLEAGDFLCIDSSHILMPGSDVDLALNRILPALPSGIIVSFHDIFLPYPYPPDWNWRNYNEQNGVGVLLQGGYEILFASHYVVREMAPSWEGTVIADIPVLEGAHECALWLRKG